MAGAQLWLEVFCGAGPLATSTGMARIAADKRPHLHQGLPTARATLAGFCGWPSDNPRPSSAPPAHCGGACCGGALASRRGRFARFCCAWPNGRSGARVFALLNGPRSVWSGLLGHHATFARLIAWSQWPSAGRGTRNGTEDAGRVLHGQSPMGSWDSFTRPCWSGLKAQEATPRSSKSEATRLWCRVLHGP